MFYMFNGSLTVENQYCLYNHLSTTNLKGNMLLLGVSLIHGGNVSFLSSLLYSYRPTLALLPPPFLSLHP